MTNLATIISAAAFINALAISGKEAADVMCLQWRGRCNHEAVQIFISVGVRPENLILCDSEGIAVIYKGVKRG